MLPFPSTYPPSTLFEIVMEGCTLEEQERNQIATGFS
jgi:hypothetical protein